MNFMFLFVAATVVNVILSTIKSIVTVKGGKIAAALMNGLTYGIYTYVIILTADDAIPPSFKAAITLVINVVCVYVVKLVEEKRTPIKMWKIEMAVKVNNPDAIKRRIEIEGIPCNYNQLGKWTVYNCYCDSCKQSSFVKELCMKLNGKISAYESKSL